MADRSKASENEKRHRDLQLQKLLKEEENRKRDIVSDMTRQYKSRFEELCSKGSELEREKDEARAYAATGFARDILSVADNLARAVQAIPEPLRADDSMKGLVIGLEATQRELEKVFASHGITRIAATGLPLDPNQHQAMLEVPSNDVEPGTIVQELQAGWMIKDRLLRAAMVAVAKKPD